MWDNRVKFVSLIRSSSIEQFMRQKENFWNNNISNNNERVLTLTNKYKFNVIVSKQIERVVNPEFKEFWRYVKMGRMMHGVPPDEFLDIATNFNFLLKSKSDGTIHEFSFESFFSKLKEVIIDDLKSNSESQRFTNKALSYDERVKSIISCKNNFNNIDLKDVIVFFQPLRQYAKCSTALKFLNLSDDQFIQFITINFIKNSVDSSEFLNIEYKKGTKGKLLTLFHQFFVYSIELTGEQKRGKLEYYKQLYLRTFLGLDNIKDSNFASTDIEFVNLFKIYRNENNLIS